MIQESKPEVHRDSGPSFTPEPMASSSKSKKSKDPNVSSLDAKTEALHAFRTITTMLSVIQSTRVTAGNEPKFASGSHVKHFLQVLDALAAVLIRNNGVVAVTACPQADSDGSGKVEVLASFLGNAEKSLTHPISQPASPGAIQFLRNIFISQNPRDLSVKQGGEVVDPETVVPKAYRKNISKPTELLNTFLTNIWWVFQ
jgi:hypothetical protein